MFKDLSMEQSQDNAAWAESVRRVLDRDAPRGMMEQRTMYHGAMTVQRRVPTRYALTPRALLAVARHHSISAHDMGYHYVMLVQRGYPVDVSLLLYRNLRLMFPDFTSAQGAWQLMGKSQLEKELGTFYGHLVAMTLADPTSNPVLYAMLMCSPETQIPLSFGVAAAQVSIDEQAAQRGNWSPLVYELGRVDGCNEGEKVEVRYGPEAPVISRDYLKADNLYRTWTGQALTSHVCLNPREYDYEEITEKVREAHCPASVCDGGAPVGARPVFLRRHQDGDGGVTG